MQIWSAEIKELETLYSSLKGRLPDLEKDLDHLIRTEDENVVLLYSRRCLEIIVTDLCQCELKRSRKTEPLKGVIDKLHREEKVPDHIIASMHSVNSLSTFGTHPKDFDPEQVKPVLNNLSTILKWYLKYKETQTISQIPSEYEGAVTGEESKTRKGIRKSRNKYVLHLSRLAVAAALIVIALYIFNKTGSRKLVRDPEKSIAILPFRNDSPDEGAVHIINGTMEAILDNLSKIKNIRVISRTSVEQYRDKARPLPQIAKELKVSYILEGSGQKYGDDISLTVQLLDAVNDRHLWSSPYKRKINDIFALQSEIAQAIASKIKATITPEEKKLIERIPTANIAAYDLYLKANDYREDYNRTNNLSSYQTAINLYSTALKVDPSFARAYTGLARSYYDRYYWPDYFKENFLDSCLILANKALSLDDQLDEAYYLKGLYYSKNGFFEEALKNFDNALILNPNSYQAYSEKSYILTWMMHDYVKGIYNYDKALNLISGDERPDLLRELGRAFLDVGFTDKARDYYHEAYILDSNFVLYTSNIAYLEFHLGNIQKSYELNKQCLEIDTSYLINIPFLAPGHEEEGYLIARKYVEKLKKTGSLPVLQSHRIGHAFWLGGNREEAKYYFEQQIKFGEESIKLGRDIAQRKAAQYDLAATYAFLGEKEKAYRYLDEFNTIGFHSFVFINLIKQDPLFEGIRSEKRFQRIVQSMEAKYQAEHDRVERGLSEQGML